MSPHEDQLALARWRLLLGRFAERPLAGTLEAAGGAYRQMDQTLEFLYGREYAGRGVRPGERRDGESREGGLGPTNLTVPRWLGQVRELFPRETCQLIQRHALERYGLRQLVTDPEVLRTLEPDYELLKTLLTFRELLHGQALELARRIIRQVVEEITRRLSLEVRQALWGKLSRQRRSPQRIWRNLDMRRTIRDNLRHYDPERKRLLARRLHFFSRVRPHMAWHIVMAVDCSGSMLDSVIHSAVMAGVFHGLPALRTRLVAFDTSVVDFSDQIADPAAVLMNVQLGGGTDIAQALRYCEQLVVAPTRTIVVLVTDFEEGGPSAPMIAAVRRLREAGARVLALAALDQQARPVYNEHIAEECAAAGAEVAALTPGRLAEWLAQVIS